MDTVLISEDSFAPYVLTNVILNTEYDLALMPYEYIFFRIPAFDERLEGIELRLNILSEQALLVLNEYLGNEPVLLHTAPDKTPITVQIDGSFCERGENILAYKGQIRLCDIRFITGDGVSAGSKPLSLEPPQEGNLPSFHSGRLRSQERQAPRLNQDHCLEDPVTAAAAFLLQSRIKHPSQSPFVRSCYALYDYTNRCYRMPCWLWSDAPAASAFLALAQRTSDTTLRKQYEQAALGIGEVFLRTQILNPEDEIYGALVSRFRYYGKTNRSFHKLCGMNDTSFSVKWALLPLYQYTGEQKYLDASRLALDWVEKNVRSLDFVPSHYYHEDKIWENRAFVDTGFCAEGFGAYTAIEQNPRYEEAACFLTDRFLSQFKLPGGFYGQNYIPGLGVDDRLFTRGQAWVLEGLIACFKITHNMAWIDEAQKLSRLLMQVQREEGSWSYLLGYGEARKTELEGTGVCEKATAVLAFLFSELYRLSGNDAFRATAAKAIQWCENNMAVDAGDGYGGIMARSLASGITSLPFLDVATGYANAFYILAKLIQE